MSKKFELPEIVNRKARFNYEFIESYSAGMVLTGTEIKSIKEALDRVEEKISKIESKID